MEKISDKIVKDYILGKCSSKELAYLAEWIKRSDENAQWLFRMADIYHTGRAMHQNDTQRTERAERRLMDRIGQIDACERHRRRIRICRYVAVAVFTFLIASAGMLYWYRQDKMLTVVTAANEVRHVVLPDSSEVWLNTASTLKYPKDFSSRNREITLDGEACFEVRKDVQRPFVVKSECLTTQVLGTVFNFNARSSEQTVEVALLEGSVRVSGNHDEGMITIHPNQKVVLDKASRQMEVVQVYAPLTTAWRDHTIPFRNMRLTEIVSALEDYYHVDIEISPGLLSHATYSGVIDCKPSIDSVLYDLSYSVPFVFRRVGNRLILSVRK